MKIGVLGTGVVGRTIAQGLVAGGHQVRLGSRAAKNPPALAWAKKAGRGASVGTFADAAQFGEMLFNCTLGTVSVDVLKSLPSGDRDGKVLVDVANPLDFSHGMPPTLFVANSDSLGERIQAALPRTRVVKTLNTVSSVLMVQPTALANGEHTLFLCGNDAGAKRQVQELLTKTFGWKDVMDLGDITMARGLEGYLLLWTRLFGALGTPSFNIRVIR